MTQITYRTQDITWIGQIINDWLIDNTLDRWHTYNTHDRRHIIRLSETILRTHRDTADTQTVHLTDNKQTVY